MAKAVKIYSDKDSIGRPFEIAQRDDGKWFHREYRYNGYGMGWSKWISYMHHTDWLESLREVSPKGIRLPNPLV